MERVISTSMTRRRLLAMGGSVVAVGLASRLLPAAAQASDATMGYPHLEITVEDKTIKVPAQIPAGLTFITLTNASKTNEGALVLGSLAEGVSKDDVAAALAKPSATQGSGDPAIELLKSSKITLLGGPMFPNPGESSSGITRFSEGTHVVANAFGEQVAFFDVTPAGANGKTEEPKAEWTVKLGNMVFVGLDDGVPAGKHLWQIENIDTMEHELIIAPAEPGMTADDFKKMLEQFSEEGGPATPPASDSGGEQSADSGGGNDQSASGASIMSSGQKTWQVIDLPAGHYVAFCMIPMDWSGPPHAMMGMIKVFDVK